MPVWAKPFILCIAIGTISLLIAAATGDVIGLIIAGMCYIGVIWQLVKMP